MRLDLSLRSSKIWIIQLLDRKMFLGLLFFLFWETFSNSSCFITQAMAYIHSSEIRSHGNLKSSNCVVDSRFVLKVTDFGLHSLRVADDEADDQDSYVYWKRKLFAISFFLDAVRPARTNTFFISATRTSILPSVKSSCRSLIGPLAVSHFGLTASFDENKKEEEKRIFHFLSNLAAVKWLIRRPLWLDSFSFFFSFRCCCCCCCSQSVAETRAVLNIKRLQFWSKITFLFIIRQVVDGAWTAAHGASSAGRDAQRRRLFIRHHRSRDPRPTGTFLPGRQWSQPQR